MCLSCWLDYIEALFGKRAVQSKRPAGITRPALQSAGQAYFFARPAGFGASWVSCELAALMFCSIASMATLALRFSWA